MSSAIDSCVNQVSLSDEQPCQGIGGSECEQPKTKTNGVSSLRRTLSAVDMSSTSGFSPLKRIASSDELKIDQQQPGQFDIFCSIPIQKPSSLPPPYVHPLVRKSKSCLSLKSLEICTENLGSESGSDGYSPSKKRLSDTDEEHEEIQEVVKQEESIQQVVVVEETKRPEVVEFDVKDVVTMMNYGKKSSPPPSATPRSFPPPLTSLSKPGGGGIQMKIHRKDGRLVLEAVSVTTSQNYFNSQRQDGRLVLTFASPIPESKTLEESIKEDEEEDDKGIVLEMTSTTRVPNLQPTGVMNIHRIALMANKFIGLTNSTTRSLSSRNNNLVSEVIPQSFSISPPLALAAGEAAPPPRMFTQPQKTVAAASFNSYEYSWRKETFLMASVGGIYVALIQQSLPTSNTKNAYNNSNNLLTSSKNNYYTSNDSSNNLSTTKGGTDYKEEKQNGVGHLILLPAYCNKPETRRPLVFWGPPHCIATS